MSAMSGKRSGELKNLQYQNGNLLTKRVTDVFLWSEKKYFNYVAWDDKKRACLS